jgi:hypothetical protein
MAGIPGIFQSLRGPIGSGRKPRLQLIVRLRASAFRQLKIAPSYQPARLGIFSARRRGESRDKSSRSRRRAHVFVALRRVPCLNWKNK